MTEPLIVFTQGPCAACGREELLCAATAACPCLVCADCAGDFMADGVCGVCGTAFATTRPRRRKERPTPYISGQVLMRKVETSHDGRTLFAVIGLVAVPPGEEWQDGHQYTVLAFNNEQLTIDLASAIDRQEETRGRPHDDCLTLPIWRV
jgi:hypothetical protein